MAGVKAAAVPTRDLFQGGKRLSALHADLNTERKLAKACVRRGLTACCQWKRRVAIQHYLHESTFTMRLGGRSRHPTLLRRKIA